MEKELLRRQQLEALNETARLEEEKKFEEMQKKHDDHPKLHHPVRMEKHRALNIYDCWLLTYLR